MWIRAFWAEGFRSLRDVAIPELGPFNIFYGENGAGKSNILAALDLLVRASQRLFETESFPGPVQAEWVGELVTEDDFCRTAASPRIRLGMTVTGAEDLPPSLDGAAVNELSFEVLCQQLPGRRLALELSRLANDVHGDHLAEVRSATGGGREYRERLARWFEGTLAPRAFRLVPAVRAVRREFGSLRHAVDKPALSDLFEQGRIKEAFVYALTSPDPVVRDRFARLRQLLAGEPLHRPPFDPVYDPQRGQFELRERAPGERDGPLDLAGLGIQQIYTILGQIMLGRATAVGIEEPEAHLHAPTSGRHLRTLLTRLVERGDVGQLFITTHSNLFDLDPTGYFDVRLEQGATVVERKTNLSEIDRRHLYEPGPAKHGLEDLLRLVDPATQVLRLPEGPAVTAAEMLTLLQEDAPEAVEFLREVHGAAVRAVQLRAARKP